MTDEGAASEKSAAGLKDEFAFGEPAEVLVELAKKGEIDPWDIDIARTTQRFLEYIDSLEKRDLRIPARTLLYAAMLLRMKSDFIEGARDEEPELIPDEVEFEVVETIDGLPQPPIRRHTKRPVTLEELISELRKAEMVGRRKAMRERWPDSPVEKAMDLSHEEGIEDRIKALGPILDSLFESSKIAAFTDVKSKERIMDYVSLLFMAQRRQVWLEQEEFFQELYIRRHP